MLLASFFLQSCHTSMPIRIDKHGNALASNVDYYYDYEGEENNDDEVGDPLEGFNRVMFSINIFLLENIAAPVISFYKKITNQTVRDMVSNFGNRIQDPMILVNSILQFDIRNTGKTLAVFVTNMTIGCLGLFDPAKSLFSLEREKRDLGQTLALYGFNGGFFVMAPIFGPYTFRDGFGFTASFYTNPLSYNAMSIAKEGSWTPWYLIAPKYFAQYVDTVDGVVSLNENFVQKAFDPYIFMRDSYLQNRNYNINKIRGSR